MAGVFGVLIFLVAAISGIFAVLVWSLWMIKPKGNTHKLWSIWQRDHIAVKNDKFIGKSTTKDTQGNVVAVFLGWVCGCPDGLDQVDLTKQQKRREWFPASLAH